MTAGPRLRALVRATTVRTDDLVQRRGDHGRRASGAVAMGGNCQDSAPREPVGLRDTCWPGGVESRGRIGGNRMRSATTASLVTLLPAVRVRGPVLATRTGRHQATHPFLEFSETMSPCVVPDRTRPALEDVPFGDAQWEVGHQHIHGRAPRHQHRKGGLDPVDDPHGGRPRVIERGRLSHELGLLRRRRPVLSGPLVNWRPMGGGPRRCWAGERVARRGGDEAARPSEDRDAVACGANESRAGPSIELRRGRLRCTREVPSHARSRNPRRGRRAAMGRECATGSSLLARGRRVDTRPHRPVAERAVARTACRVGSTSNTWCTSSPTASAACSN